MFPSLPDKKSSILLPSSAQNYHQINSDFVYKFSFYKLFFSWKHEMGVLNELIEGVGLRPVLLLFLKTIIENIF